MRPRTTCLYSEGSRLPRSLSAIRNIRVSKPRVAPLLSCFFFVRAMASPGEIFQIIMLYKVFGL